MGERKQRSDKKRDVQPTVSIELKDAVYRLAYLTQTHVKDACEQMIKYAMTDNDIVHEISKHFRRDIRIGNTLHRGSMSNLPVDRRIQGECERMTTRLKSNDYELLNAFSYALDVRPARTCAILIDAAMHDFKFVNNYVKKYLHEKLDSVQLQELRGILHYINENSDNHQSWSSLISAIANEVTTPITKIKDAVNEFIIKSWRN